MSLRKFLKIIVGLLLLSVVIIGFISIKHPIIVKWVTGSAKDIGKPIEAIVYTNGQVNGGIKVFHADTYWGNNKKANNYLISLTEYDSPGKLKFFNINVDEMARHTSWTF